VKVIKETISGSICGVIKDGSTMDDISNQVHENSVYYGCRCVVEEID